MNKKDMSFCQNGPLTDKSPLLGIFRKGPSRRKIRRENRKKRHKEYADNRNSGMTAEEALNAQKPVLD